MTPGEPVVLIGAGENRLERRYDTRIELAVNRLSEPESSDSTWHGVAIGPIRRHRVVRVADRDDRRLERQVTRRLGEVHDQQRSYPVRERPQRGEIGHAEIGQWLRERTLLGKAQEAVWQLAARGFGLWRGDVVITGSLVVTVDIGVGERLDFAIDGIGETSMTAV